MGFLIEGDMEILVLEIGVQLPEGQGRPGEIERLLSQIGKIGYQHRLYLIHGLLEALCNRSETELGT